MNAPDLVALRRTKRLGNLAEGWAEMLLRDAGFVRIVDLNAAEPDHAGGDFLADRGGARFLISVKARNKFQHSGALNGSYNIFPEKVRRAASRYDAIPAWLTIQVDTDQARYSAYFGLIDELPNPNAVGVPMTAGAVENYECLAKDRTCPDITIDLSNRVRAKPVERREEENRRTEAMPSEQAKLPRRYTTKQMGDACEMLVAAELTLAGVPALKVPDNWPGYDVIAQPLDGAAQRISVKARTFKRGPAYVGYNDFDEFDWLAIVLLPSAEFPERTIYVVPRDVAEGLARRDKPTSKTAAERYFRVDQVPAVFADWRSNFGLVQAAVS